MSISIRPSQGSAPDRCRQGPIGSRRWWTASTRSPSPWSASGASAGSGCSCRISCAPKFDEQKDRLDAAHPVGRGKLRSHPLRRHEARFVDARCRAGRRETARTRSVGVRAAVNRRRRVDRSHRGRSTSRRPRVPRVHHRRGRNPDRRGSAIVSSTLKLSFPAQPSRYPSQGAGLLGARRRDSVLTRRNDPEASDAGSAALARRS